MEKKLFDKRKVSAQEPVISDQHPVAAGIGGNSTAVATLDDLKGMGFDPAENLKDETPAIPLIKVLPQAQMFSMPDDSKVTTLRGVVVETHRCNAWWDPKNKIEGDRPNCSSLNDLTPLPDSPNKQSDFCASCKLNKFGSGTDQTGQPSGGKGCKNMRRMYLLMDGHEFPYMLSLSPTSLKAAKNYLTQLSDRGRNVATVETEFALVKTTKGSNVYSVVSLAAAKDIDDTETLRGILKIKKQIAEIVRTQAITGAEYEEADPLQKNQGDVF